MQRKNLILQNNGGRNKNARLKNKKRIDKLSTFLINIIKTHSI